MAITIKGALKLVALVGSYQEVAPEVDLQLPALLQVVPDLGQGSCLFVFALAHAAVDAFDQGHIFVCCKHDAAS